ncbi:MAG: hypothetical protein V4632_09480 [Pseudomonadota bacterium]
MRAGSFSGHGQAGVSRSRPMPARQDGVVLYIALIVLIAMTLAGSALIRSADTGTMVAGNLAFKKAATLASDAGAEAAISYLLPLEGSATLHQDQAASGYYATAQSSLDLTGNSGIANLAKVDWDDNNCNGAGAAACIKASAPLTTDGAGNTVTYIIHRLCQAAGDSNSTSNSCVTYQSVGASPKRGELKYGDDKRFEPLPTVYYRITTRVKGPRNTVSFVETMLHF